MLTTPAGRERARTLGIPFSGEPGPLNAITDVAGIEVGYSTLIRGEGARIVGQGPVRTGVTAILPRGRGRADESVFASMFSLNGNGELTGSHWAAEVGRCEGPILLTNTHSVGAARDASIKWLVGRFRRTGQWSLPVVGETYDGWLNDIDGFHVAEPDIFAALEGARGGRIEEGNVGGGTGMICYGFKGGSGTASRKVKFAGDTFTLGAFVQANFGLREQLVIAGVRVGEALKEWKPETRKGEETGSIIAILATDAPLIPHQLSRLARRVALGVGRSGSVSGHGSGDIFLAFSTANAEALAARSEIARAALVPDPALNPFFAATIEAVDEAVLNAICAAETMTGADDHTVPALPHEEVRALMEKYASPRTA